jgi:hypothetical protein
VRVLSEIKEKRRPQKRIEFEENENGAIFNEDDIICFQGRDWVFFTHKEFDKIVEKYKKWKNQDKTIIINEETKMNNKINELAKDLHKWYLEATKDLNPESYNPNAQKTYNKLTKEQKFIDRFIAKKILERFEKE